MFHVHFKVEAGKVSGRGGPGCHGRCVVVVTMVMMLMLRWVQVKLRLVPAVNTLSGLEVVIVRLGAKIKLIKYLTMFLPVNYYLKH